MGWDHPQGLILSAGDDPQWLPWMCLTWILKTDLETLKRYFMIFPVPSDMMAPDFVPEGETDQG